ncbi:MAG TPA: sugar transferase [Gemmatimonadaceae bacterium]|nr:sugar transferase [Gemmatimonadaceae bacterium]
MRRHRNRSIARCGVLLAADIATLLLARLVLLSIRDAHILGGTLASVVQTLLPHGSFHVLQLVIAVLLGLAVFQTYRPADYRRDASAIVSGSAAGLALVCWGWLWSAFSWYHLIGCVIVAIGVGSTLVVERFVVDGVVRRVRQRRGHLPRAVVIGAAPAARRLLRHPMLSDPGEFTLVGYLDTRAPVQTDALGRVAELVRIIEQYNVDTIVLSSDCDASFCRDILDVADAAGCHVLVASHWTEIGHLRPQLIWRRGTPLMQLTSPGVKGHQFIIKRAVDLLLSGLGLIVLSPALLLIALAVRLSSPGPALFAQTRVGRGGRVFRIYKFRSMVQDAEQQRSQLAPQSLYGDERLFKVKDDPRVTAVGRLLRRTSLDELPQLWNVLRGEMSLVGPRPPLPSEVSLYEEHHYSRFEMKPGITGPWQVQGRNTITDFEQVMRIESQWMRQWSIWKDFVILAATVPVVLRMEGAH